MKYVRLHTDKSGQSHFEQTTLKLDEADYRPPSPLVFVSHAYRTDALQFVRFPPGWESKSFNPPSKQFMIYLKGHVEVTASDGGKRSFGPGDTILMEDVDGKGHHTRVKGADECLAAIIPIN